jgi:hypothetical protein
MSELQETMTPFTVLDLADVKEALGDHYNHTARDFYTGYCDCGEEIGQEYDRCPFCRRSVVWRGSRLWRSMYGKPEDAIRRLSVIPPTDAAGEYLCRLVGVAGFANQGEAKRWARAVKKIGQPRAVDAARYIESHWKGRRAGRGTISHALNLVEKIAREQEGPQESAPETLERASTIQQTLAGRTIGDKSQS